MALLASPVETSQSEPGLLIVEDEKKLANSLRRQLEKQGYRVEVAFDGREALQMLKEKPFALLLLDLSLPEKSGWDILEWMRSTPISTPVIIISANPALQDRVKALDQGADDFLVKPFDSSELLARVNTVLRRSGSPRSHMLEADDLRMDVLSRTVVRGSDKIELSPREFALLEFLMRNKNQLVTRQRIYESVWGYKFECMTNIVDVYISYLRTAIDKKYPKKLIHTMNREGFILSA